MKSYTLNVAGLTRELPIIKLSDELSIASFVILGDTELVEKTAKLLAEKLPEVDVLVTAEAKGIPLTYEISKLLNLKSYIVARKSIKAYMNSPIEVSVNSITTTNIQKLFLNNVDADFIKGKRVALIDDVISTGQSLKALEELVKKAGANIVAKAAILAEGDAKNREDIIFLEELPLFK
ncbi:phosphoribosyltransferase family protein [Fusobacterium sp.]|uniref:phosphoribosyltransferase family protein n=2 Tax=Fusobacteriaceae TaxID=203492 RepID=UPI0025BE1D1D|nr:phosphoribosyltransferase family protein [Fusobacterium sp.]MCI7222690.1 adenine phosphoribosyltransferase [Fusobacterium sp.]